MKYECRGSKDEEKVCVFVCMRVCVKIRVCVCVSTRLSGNKISLNLTKLQANKKDEEDGGHLSL